MQYFTAKGKPTLSMCKRKIRWTWWIVCLATLPCFPQEQPDLGVVSKIRYESFRNSRVMEIARGLVDGIGPRLTGSPNMKKANEWTRDKLKELGLSNVHLESWGPFGRGWSNEFISVHMTSPFKAPLIAYARAWTPGTNGPVTASVVRLKYNSIEDLKANYSGKLAGKILLIGDPQFKLPTEPMARRFTDKSLTEMEEYGIPSDRNAQPAYDSSNSRARMLRQLTKFWQDEKVVALVDDSDGDFGGGTVFVQAGGSWKAGETSTVPQLTMANEHWNRIARLLQQNQSVELELNIKNTYYDDATTQYNTIAEIPGSDKKDEVVMLGAHLDSWHTGTGATDNAAGVAVVMEAMRILKALDLKPRLTIRVALWSGEEQGLLGSQWYVMQHFGTRQPPNDPDRKDDPTVLRRDYGPLQFKPEQAKVSVYFNVDNGTGKIRGIYLQENSAVQPIFEAWMRPFADLGMNTLTLRNTGATDHLSFNAVGIPAFQFIQDPLDYQTRSRHSNIDTWERLQPDDLKQMAAIVATFAYDAAMHESMLPRKPIEKAMSPQPQGR
jgi:carboxypeptidase Q